LVRRWRRDEVDALCEIHFDPAVAYWLSGFASQGDVERAIYRFEQHWDELGFGRFAVEKRDTGALVGRVGIMASRKGRACPACVWVRRLGAAGGAGWGQGGAGGLNGAVCRGVGRTCADLAAGAHGFRKGAAGDLAADETGGDLAGDVHLGA